MGRSLTVNSISSIALVLILDKSKTSHELDFCNLARSSSRREVVLDIRLGGYNMDPWSVIEAALSTRDSTREEQSICIDDTEQGESSSVLLAK